MSRAVLKAYTNEFSELFIISRGGGVINKRLSVLHIGGGLKRRKKRYVISVWSLCTD